MLSNRLASRVLLLLITGSAVIYVACSDDPEPNVGPRDAGGEPPVDPPQLDAEPPCDDNGAGADCTTDGGFPNDLRCTGLYSCWSPKRPAATSLLFKPGPELWSDGAEKSRWISIPAGAKVDADPTDGGSRSAGWKFPVGTKVWKEFKVGGKRLETRLLVKARDAVGVGAWDMTVYRWADDGESTATRFEAGAVVNGYEIPKPTACPTCHRGSYDMLLGFEEWSLSVASAEGLTTAKLVERGLISPAPPTSLSIPNDTSGKAAPALGWLHANCGSSCHNNHGGQASYTNLFLDLPADLTLTDVTKTNAYATAVGKAMTVPRYTSNAQFDGFLRITKGDPAKSLIPVVDSIRNPDGGLSDLQMPPLLQRKADPQVQLVRDWISVIP
jgi:hypothetical protein